jgi:hypothetical protein
MSEVYKPRLHPKFSYGVYRVGNEQTPLLVVDNFLDNAQRLIELCIENYQFDRVDNYYPGRRMDAPVAYTYAIHFYLLKLIAEVFGLTAENVAGIKSLYSLVITPPEQLTIQQCLPHIDSYLVGDLACVHYLCDQNKGGTSLYRHKKTGYEKLTAESIDYYKQTVLDEGALAIEKKAYMNGSNDYFEAIAEIEAQFNRMIIYPSNILHSGNIAPGFDFDPNPASGRLTLNSFIYSKRP